MQPLRKQEKTGRVISAKIKFSCYFKLWVDEQVKNLAAYESCGLNINRTNTNRNKQRKSSNICPLYAVQSILLSLFLMHMMSCCVYIIYLWPRIDCSACPHLVILRVGLQQAVLLDGHWGRQRDSIRPLFSFLLTAALHARWGRLGQGAAAQPLIAHTLERNKERWLSNDSSKSDMVTVIQHYGVSSYFFQGLILWRGGAVVRVLLRAGHRVHVLPRAIAVLLMLVGELLDVAVGFTGAKPPNGTRQPLP